MITETDITNRITRQKHTKFSENSYQNGSQTRGHVRGCFSEKSRLHQNAYHLLYRIYLSIRALNVHHINNHIMPSSNITLPSSTFLSASRRHCYGTNILIIFGNKACYQATINAWLAYTLKVFEWKKNKHK